MLILPPAQFRRQRGRVEYRSAENPAPPAPLTLVSAWCDEGVTLWMKFDRAIDIAAFDVAVVRLDDAGMGFTYVGVGAAELLDALTVQLSMSATDDYFGEETLLTVPAENGIVAVDGGAWGGVTELELPFGV